MGVSWFHLVTPKSSVGFRHLIDYRIRLRDTNPRVPSLLGSDWLLWKTL